MTSKILVICFGMLVLASCSNQEPITIVPEPVVVVPVPVVVLPAPVVVKEFTVTGWNASWSTFIRARISDSSLLLIENPDREYWVRFFAAMAKAESNFKLGARYVEALGKDAVTGKTNTSEGLLQMSYQDSRYHGCNFNWAIDKHLKYNNLEKTIFDPIKNLECGIIVLEKQLLKRKVLYTVDRPYYWAVLHKSRPGYPRFRKYLTEFLSN